MSAPGDGVAGTVRGIGVDAVDVARFKEVMTRRPAVLDRLFTEAERAYAERSPNPALRLAARFAAKEAVLKALGVGLGEAAFRDVEVVRAESGEPHLSSRAAPRRRRPTGACSAGTCRSPTPTPWRWRASWPRGRRGS